MSRVKPILVSLIKEQLLNFQSQQNITWIHVVKLQPLEPSVTSSERHRTDLGNPASTIASQLMEWQGPSADGNVAAAVAAAAKQEAFAVPPERLGHHQALTGWQQEHELATPQATRLLPAKGSVNPRHSARCSLLQ